jgi:O-antigen/teichoic acid export membrane protein
MKKNTAANMLFFVLTFPIMFIITPMILKYVGKEAYGVWALTGTILVFIELFGGLQTPSALSVFIPKYEPKTRHKDINELVNTTFFFFLSTAALLAGIYFLTEPLLLKAFFKVDAGLLETARFVLGVSVYAFLINFVMMGFGYLMCGFNVFYVLSIMHTVTAYVRFGLMAAALLAGFGIKGIVTVQMGTLLLESVITLVCTKIIFPPLGFGLKYFSLQKLKALLGLSVKLFFTKASTLVNQNIDKLILGYFINPVMAAYYQIGSSISKYISQVPEMLGLFSLLPAASELKARGMMEKIKVMFDRVNKYMFFLAVFLMAGIMIFGKEFIRLWLGEGYENVYIVMMALAAGYTYNLVGYASMHILNGLEKTRETMTVSIFSALINVILSVVLTWKFGMIGALCGTLISIVIGSSLLYIIYFKILGHGLNISGIFIKPAMSALAGFGVIYLVESRFILSSAWPIFFLKALIFSAVYFGLTVFVLRQFDPYDFELLKGFISKKTKVKS